MILRYIQVSSDGPMVLVNYSTLWTVSASPYWLSLPCFCCLGSHPQIYCSHISLCLRLWFWGNPGEDNGVPLLNLLFSSSVFGSNHLTSLFLLPQLKMGVIKPHKVVTFDNVNLVKAAVSIPTYIRHLLKVSFFPSCLVLEKGRSRKHAWPPRP